jgi:hypothetical protein
MNKKVERMMELIVIALMSVFAVKAHEVNDMAHLGLYVLAATLTMVWIVIDTAE